ncbi:MAG: transposase [Pirellulaceae bacterium]
MSDYRRYFVHGGTFFFTIVTYTRRPILTTERGRKCLGAAIAFVRTRHPFYLVANVLLPDHWHLIMQLPSGDERYSLRIKQIKEEFTKHWLDAGFFEANVTDSQKRRGERGVWQPRFWEHMIRDEHDLERCADYIHWNPRKHKLVKRVRDWKWSSFHRFVRSGQYDIDWGGTAPNTGDTEEWGEP